MNVPLKEQRRARDIVATLIARGHAWIVPIFLRIEAEIAKAETTEGAIERARAIAAASRIGGKNSQSTDHSAGRQTGG